MGNTGSCYKLFRNFFETESRFGIVAAAATSRRTRSPRQIALKHRAVRSSGIPLISSLFLTTISQTEPIHTKHRRISVRFPFKKVTFFFFFLLRLLRSISFFFFTLKHISTPSRCRDRYFYLHDTRYTCIHYRMYVSGPRDGALGTTFVFVSGRTRTRARCGTPPTST